ncbi:MAG: hypothetical protein GY842_01215 [bacterium]|nr:hypothetical protein [bacterium]
MLIEYSLARGNALAEFEQFHGVLCGMSPIRTITAGEEEGYEPSGSSIPSDRGKCF